MNCLNHRQISSDRRWDGAALPADPTMDWHFRHLRYRFPRRYCDLDSEPILTGCYIVNTKSHNLHHYQTELRLTPIRTMSLLTCGPWYPHWIPMNLSSLVTQYHRARTRFAMATLSPEHNYDWVRVTHNLAGVRVYRVDLVRSRAELGYFIDTDTSNKSLKE
jgi:hypothetical protein